MFQWETWLHELPTGGSDLRVGIFLSSLKISAQFFFYMPSRNQCPLLSFFTRICQNKMAKIKISTKSTNFATKMFLLFQMRKCKCALSVCSQIKKLPEFESLNCCFTTQCRKHKNPTSSDNNLEFSDVNVTCELSHIYSNVYPTWALIWDQFCH